MTRRLAVVLLLLLLSVAAAPVFSQPQILFIDERGNPTDEAVDYGRVRIRLLNSGLNGDSGLRNTAQAGISSSLGGDTETVTLTETGESTGIFEGEIDLWLNASPGGDRAGYLDTARSGPSYSTNEILTVTDLYNASATAEVFSSRTELVDAHGNAVSSYYLGGSVHVRVRDKYSDTPALDTTTAALTTSGGDQETLRLVETGIGTGIFQAALPVAEGTAVPGNGVVETAAGETLQVSHPDVNGVTASTATAGIDPITVQFIDAEGRPASVFLEGSRAYLRMGGKPFDAAPLLRESYPVIVSSQLTGDTEYFLLWETGLATGVYEGSVRLSNGAPATNDGAVQTDRVPGSPPQFDTLEVIVNHSSGVFRAEAKTAGSIVRLVDEWGRDASAFASGSKLRVRVEDAAVPASQTIRTTQVTLLSLSYQDEENLTLKETGLGTGIFEGEIPFRSGHGFSYNGILNAFASGETLEARHTDGNGETVTTDKAVASDVRTLLLDPSGRPTSTMLESALHIVRVWDISAASQGLGSLSDKAIAKVSGDQETLSLQSGGGQPFGVFQGTITAVTGSSPQYDGKVRVTGNFSAPDASDTVNINHYPVQFGYIPSSSAIARSVRSRTRLLDDRGLEAASYVPGAQVQIEVEDHVANTTAAADSTTVLVISTTTGDQESLLLTETGLQTGLFRGSLPTTAFASSPGDGRLQAAPGEAVAATYAPPGASYLSTDTAPVLPRSLEIVDPQGRPAPAIPMNGRARVRAFDAEANSNPGQPDTLQVRIYSLDANGWSVDDTTLTLTETGPDTSLFTGSIRLSAGSGGNGVLQTIADGPPADAYGSVAAYLEDLQDTVRLTDSVLQFVNAQGTEISTVALGPVRVQLERPRSNLNPAAAEAESVTVSSLNAGETLSVTLTETGPDTGIFEGSVLTQLGTVANDGILQVQIGETLEARKTVSPYLVALARAMVVSRPNVAPVAVNDSATTNEDVPVTVAVLANDSDADGDTLSLTSASVPSGASFRINADKTITYTPKADTHGSQTFTYTISDGYGGTATGQVFVTVVAVDDPPQPRSDNAFTNEEQPVTVFVLANDIEPDGQTITLVSVTPGQKGTATINANNSLTYRPNLNAYGNDSFSYTVSDGVNTAQSSVFVTISNINDPPVAVDDAFTMDEDLDRVFYPASNDIDSDSSLNVSGIPQALHGTVSRFIVNNSFTYRPHPNYHGTDTITYTVTDGPTSDIGIVTVTINPVNDFPTVVGDSVTTQEDVPATVNVLANDSDVDGDTLTVTAVTQGTRGAVVINPDKTVTYTPNLNVSGSDSFTYTVNDGLGATRTGTVVVTITAVNDPPDAVNDSATVNEDSTVTITVLANDRDAENQTITLTAVTQGASGAVVINPNKTLTYTPAANFNGTDTFTYTISDGTSTDTATVAVTVNPINDAPDAVNDVVAADEDAAANIAVLSNDTDGDGETLAVTAVTQGTNGAVVINPDKTITYTPAANFNGTDSFTYTVSDGNGGTDTATVSVSITAVNDTPDAVNDAAGTNEDTVANIVVLSNDTDGDGETLLVTAVTQGTNGAVVINPDKTVTYTPTANFNGTDSFTYTISDGNGGTDTAAVSITIAAVNDPPVAVPDLASTEEDEPVEIVVLGNDLDVEGNALSIIAATEPEHGEITIDGAEITYTPEADFNGADTFTYTLSDGNGGTVIGTVSVTVTPVNDAPAAGDDTASSNEDSSVTVSVLDNDSDAEVDPLTITEVTQGVGGTVDISGSAVVYTPSANFNGVDSFTYTISDGNEGTATATVTVTITGVNDPPVATNDSASTNEDAAVTVSVLGNDSDLDGDSLSISAVTQGGNGSVTISGSGVVYTPNNNFNGVDSFTYTVSDGNGGTATATVSVTVSGVNDVPVATNDSASTNEDAGVTVSVLGNDSDADGDSLTISATTQGSNGSVTISGSAVVYTPNANFNGSDSFTYTVSDGNDGTATATVSITVSGVNDVPVVTNDNASTNEDAAVTVSVLGNDSDPDGDSLTISSVTQGGNGSVAISRSAIVYTPNANFNGSDSFTYTVSDGSGGTAAATVSITVSGVNDTPDAVNDAATTPEDTAVTVSVLTNDSDPDGHALSITGVTQGTRGAVTVNVNGTVTYTPNANTSGSDSFTYTVSDGNGGTDTATVSISISGVNDAPDAVNDAAATNEDTAVTISILANDLDADGEALTVTGVTQGSRGAVTLNGNGTVTYVPAANANGLDSFTYAARDGAGATDTATVTVNVAAINDAPAAAADSATTREGVAVTIDVRANDSDIEGNSLTVTGVSQPARGTAPVNANNVIYTPAANFNGTDSFTYTLSDGQGGTATGTVTVTVKDSLERVAVLATHGVWIQTGADVLSGDVIVNQSGSTPFLDGGSSELSLAGSVTTPAGWDVQANRISAAAGSDVASDAFFNQLTGSTTGTQTSPLALPVFPTLPAFPAATPGTTDINVGTNGTRTLAAGSYRDLIVGRKGTVTFTGGIYHFRSIRVDREAKLFFSAAAEVRVQQKLSTLQTTTIGPATGAAIDASSIVFFVAGLNGTGGGLSETPKAVEIGTDNVLRANLYVPNGTVWLKDRIQFWGGVLGKDVQVGPDGQVTLDSYWTGQ